MSVPAYKRQESSVEFVSKARDLYKYTKSICANKLPKRYAFYGNVKLFEIVDRMFDNVIKANSLNLQQYYAKRTELLDDALGELACLSAKLGILKLDISLDEKYWIKFGVLINLVEKLIKGVKAKDKQRMGV